MIGIIGGVAWVFDKIRKPPQLGKPPSFSGPLKSEIVELKDLHHSLVNGVIDEVKALDKLVNWAKVKDIKLPDILLAEYNGYYGCDVECPLSRIIPIQQVKAFLPNLSNDEFWTQLRDVGANIPILKSLGELSILFERPDNVHLDISKFFGDLVESIKKSGGRIIGSIPSPLWMRIPESKYKEILRNTNHLMLDFIVNYLKETKQKL